LSGKGRNSVKRLLSVAGALALVPFANAVAAQERSAQLEEIIITAQKRVESLQDAPISIKAFTSEQLEVLGIEGLGDITGKVPNLSLSPFPTDNTTLRVFIRGIGINDVQLTQDAGVGVYLDGVYIARSTGLALDVADIESMEVLRGPQGTLFGRNAIGGALNIKTARPDTGAIRFRQELTAGNRDLFKARSTLNLPLGDAIAAKLVYLNSEQDGYIRNVGPGRDFYDRKDEGYRLDLRWHASDSLTVDYSYDKSRLESVNPTRHALQPPLEEDPIFSMSMAPLDPAVIDMSSQGLPDSARTLTPLLPSDTEIKGHALTLEWDVGNITLKSITAYRETSDDSHVDLSSSAAVLDSGDYFQLATPPYSLNIVGNNVFGLAGEFSGGPERESLEHDQFSQEIHLLGEFEDSWQYLLGAYYFEESADEGRPRGVITSFYNSGLAPLGVARTDVVREESRSVDNDAWAVFSQVSYTPDILDSRLGFTLGLRYTEDTREAGNYVAQDTFLSDGAGGDAESVASRGFAQIAPAGLLLVDGYGSEEFSNFSYDFTVTYAVNDDINSYAKVATGYKTGGFNSREIVTENFEAGFDEEDIITYEIGLKSELFDRRVRLNAAVFYSEYDDVQLNLAIPPGEVVDEVTIGGETYPVTANVTDTNVFNAGETEISGLELDIMAVPTDGLILSLSYAYLDADFVEVLDPRSFADPDATFIFTNAPEHTYNASAQYTFEPLAFGVLSASLNYGYVDERSALNDTSFGDNTIVNDFALLDARLWLSDIPFAGGLLTVAAWGKNLTDEEYLSDAVATIPGSSRSVYYGEPRTYGVDLIYDFGD